MASYITPVIHGVGDVWALTDANTDAGDIVFLWQKPYIGAYNSVATSLANTAYTQITLGGIDSSGYGFSISSNNLIVPLTGTYAISAGVAYASAPGTIAAAAIYHNGSIAKNGSYPPNAVGAGSQVSTPSLLCTAGDTIGLYAYQNSGGAINTTAGSSNTYISAILMGSQ